MAIVSSGNFQDRFITMEGKLMTGIRETAMAFFDACETGKGWETCKAYCHADASFSSQAEPLAEMTTLSEYTDWAKGLLALLPDASYEIKSFAVDNDRQNVSAFGAFTGTHTGEGGPVAPTGKKMTTDYVYVMNFENGKISHMTKIWNSGFALKQVGWA